jgi:hypothetical protein
MNKDVKSIIFVTSLLVIAFLPWLFTDLNFSITGGFSIIDIAPKNFKYQASGEASATTAEEVLTESRQVIERISYRNFSISFVEDVLFEAELAFKEKDFIKVHEFTALITFIEREQLNLLDEFTLLENEIMESRRQKIFSGSSEELLLQAREALRNDQFNEARTFLNEASVELDKAKLEKSRLKGLAKLSKNFIQRHWWKILIVLTIIAVISKPLFIKIRKKRLKKKLRLMKAELVKTQDLIKNLQKSCFIDKKINTSTYKIKSNKYEERITEIKHTIPVIEAQLSGKRVKKTKKGIIEVKR